MKNITIYEVKKAGKVIYKDDDSAYVTDAPYRTRFVCLDLEMAANYARGINKLEGGALADILEGEWTPTDHTTPHALKEKAKRTKKSQMFWNKLVADAMAIRHARTPEKAPVL